MSNPYHSIPPIASYSSFPQPITALSFDPVSDILWAGSNTGDVTAYYSVQGIRGVSFRVGGGLAVNKIVAGDNHVRAVGLASGGLGTWAKGGMNKWFHRSSSTITTFSNTSNPSHLLAVASAASEILFLNFITGDVVRQCATPSVATHLHFTHTILLSGSSDGYIRVHDPRTGMTRSGTAESMAKAHASSIQGLQISGNLVFTIGMGERQSRPFPDPLVKLYDLRNMKPLAPIPFPSGPAFIHTLPKRASSIAITSNQGLINIVDAINPSSTSDFYQLDIASYITSVSVSPAAAYLAFGDAEGIIHLMTQAEETIEVPFNGFEGKAIPWADTPAPLPDIEWTDSTPLNSIGLPYYENTLLSAWSPHLASTGSRYPPPPKIPRQVLGAIKMNDNVAYAALPKELKGKRNLINSGPPQGNSRFRSGKSKDTEGRPFDASDSVVPPSYRHVEIEYSRFGVEDFDFGFYNETNFSGLETHILNSYTNSLIQVMHYTNPIRRLAKSHIATDCPREHCLLCEMGFVSRMLEDAHGTNCQSSNFCKTVGVLAQASNALELVDYGRETAGTDYSHKIQTFHRFLLDRFAMENNFQDNPRLRRTVKGKGTRFSKVPLITQLTGIDGANIITCLNCKVTREKRNVVHIVDLAYPRKGSNEPSGPFDFSTTLQSSLFRETSHKANCKNCNQYSTFVSRRSLVSKDLPPIIAVNACVYNPDDFDVWQDSRNHIFLKPVIGLRGQVEGVDDAEEVLYEIKALVVQVIAKEKPSHLVGIVKVPEEERNSDLSSPWLLFNDFVVSNISEEEALSFPSNWKTPAIVYLERVDVRENDTLDFNNLPDTMDPSILNRDTSIALNRDISLLKTELLDHDEFPTPGTQVAIDAEFVSMQQEETEYRSDGSNKVLRPARLSLARVSVLRGDGPKQGIPFIDDHIHTSEVIVDYLTEFSGIKFGDLDPHLSQHTLTPLKLVYKKLRLLVDRGCIFIGHGLSKDFRIINLYVPPEQVIDTVDLYFIKSRQRRLSLRFLSWFVLEEQIQTETHDSIEDARAALRLYKAYQDFEDQGVFDQKLEQIYKDGRQFNYKPPLPPPPLASETTGAGVSGHTYIPATAPYDVHALTGPYTNRGAGVHNTFDQNSYTFKSGWRK